MSNCASCPSKGKCGKSENECGIKNNPNNKITNVIGVMSGKGGVGKSSMTVLLAKQLARRGKRVGIMDADITGPSIPRLMGVSREKAVGSNDVIYPVEDKDGIKLMSLNFLMDDENQPVIWRGPIVGNAVKQFYTDVLWGELDVLLIDMPPGTGDVALTIMQSIPLTGIVMISTPQPMVSMIVSKALNMCKACNVKVLGIIENMSYILCPDCGKQIYLYGQNSTEKFLKDNDVELWAELPMMSAISNIDRDDDFDAETVEMVQNAIAPAVDALEKVLK
jgi:Mrp family chromosome partitioning ATPase